MGCSATYARGSGQGLAGPLLTIEEVDAETINTQTITSSTGVVNFSNVRVTGLPSSGIDSVGINVLEDRAQILFGTSPYPPSISLDVPRALVTADLADLSGFLNIDVGAIQQLSSQSITAHALTCQALQSQNIDTPSITTNGVPLYVDWFAIDSALPVLALKNNPFQYKTNSDASKSGFKIEDVFIGAAEGLAGDALLWVGKAAGSWLLSAGQGALSMMSGYASLSEAGLSIGADAAGAAGAAGGDAAIFAEGAEGMVLASTASEAASLFSSAGVLAEGGIAFSSELGEIGQGLLTGIENSSGSFLQEALPNFYDQLLGSARWVSL